MKRNIKKYLIVSLFCLMLVVSMGFFKFGVRTVDAVGNKAPWDGFDNSFRPLTGTTIVSNYVDFNTYFEAADKTPYQNKTLVIKTAADLYNFSVISLIDKTYLSLNYTLGADINYDDVSQYRNFLEPIGNTTDPFTGTFDGRGFKIIRPFMNPISDAASYEKYGELEFYSMFANNTGEIKNIGIIEPIFIQSVTFENIQHASVLVGRNDGTVENCYVIDERENGGISVEGVSISGLVAANIGVFNNSFVAMRNVKSSSVVLYNTLNPVLSRNSLYVDGVERTGTTSNLYYDNSIIVSENYNLLTNIELGKTTAELQNVKELFGNNTSFYSATDMVITVDEKFPYLRGLKMDSNNNYIINTSVDYVTMMELIDNYSRFRTQTFVLNNCLDLNEVNNKSYLSSPTGFSGTLKSSVNSTHSHPDVGGDNNYHSIYNLKIDEGILSYGYNSFAMFSSLSGHVEDINVYIEIIDDNPNSQAINLYGGIAGYLNGGTISNTHVYGIIKRDIAAGISYLGGLVGYGEGTIANSTSAGVLSGGICSESAPANFNGSSIGGILGYSENSSVFTCINAMEITGFGFNRSTVSNIKTYLGGVIGFGSVVRADQLENRGNINSLPDGSYASYNSSTTVINQYIGGVIGLLTNIDENGSNIEKLLNNGELNLVIRNQNSIAYAGVLTIKGDYSTDLTMENRDFYSLKNNGEISIVNETGSSTSDYYSSQMLIKMSGVVILESTKLNLYGVYNAGNMNVDLSLVPAFAPCVYTKKSPIERINVTTAIVDYGTEYTGYTNYIESSYNTGNINVISSTIIDWYNCWYSGNIVGQNVNLENIRNEGTIDINVSQATTKSLAITHNTGDRINSTYKHFKVFGLFEEVSLGHMANDLYNGGDVYVYKTTSETVKFCLYVSGIAYRNNNTDIVSEADKAKLNIESGKIGSINNAINNGNIRINNKDGYNNLIGSNGNFFGQSRAAGIVSINASLISNSFNLGDIYNRNIVVRLGNDNYMSSEFEVETGGITFLMKGDKAQIMDSANYGTIISDCPSGTVGWVNAGGIAVRNEKHENGNDYGGSNSSGSHFGKIEFTINYGDVYAWNYRTRTGQSYDSGSSNEPSCKASGILCIGVLTVMNVINYGDIYTNSVGSGIYGYVFLNKFTISQPNQTYITNAINYGKLYLTTETPTEYTNESYNIKSSFGTSRSFYTTTGSGANASKDTCYYIGAIIGCISITGSSTWNLSNASYRITNVTFSYLINFDEAADIIGNSLTTSASSYTDEINAAIVNMNKYMATTKEYDTSIYPFNNIKSYSYDSNNPDPTASNIYSKAYNGGMFNNSFPLQNRPTDDETFTTIPSNYFIYEYIQFIPTSKVGEELGSKIGLTGSDDSIGIYALSSSLGVENGLFIPENINLSELDPINELGERDTAWRTTSLVEDKIYSKMKQIKASIATAVYDLELISTDGSGFRLTDPEIDNEKKTITFYVPSNSDEGSLLDLGEANYREFTINITERIDDYTYRVIEPINGFEFYLESQYLDGEIIYYLSSNIDTENAYIFRYNSDTNTYQSDMNISNDFYQDVVLNANSYTTDFGLETENVVELNNTNGQYIYDEGSNSFVLTGNYDSNGNYIGYYSGDTNVEFTTTTIGTYTPPSTEVYYTRVETNLTRWYQGDPYTYTRVTELEYGTTYYQVTYARVGNYQFYHAYYSLSANALTYVGGGGVGRNSPYYYVEEDSAREVTFYADGYREVNVNIDGRTKTYYKYETDYYRTGDIAYTLDVVLAETGGEYELVNGVYQYAGPSGGTMAKEIVAFPFYDINSLTFKLKKGTKEFKVNLDSSTYELSYHASLYSNFIENLNLELGLITPPIAVGGVSESTLRIYSEAYQDDPTQYQDYTIYIIKSGEQSLNNLSSIILNNGNNILSSETTTNPYTVSSSDGEVSARDGSIRVTYNIIGVPDLLDLRNKIVLYRLDPTGDVTLNGNTYKKVTENYQLVGGITNVGTDRVDANTGVVTRIPNYDSINSIWGNGTLEYQIIFDSEALSGEYISVVELSTNDLYSVIFNRELSKEATVTSLQFGTDTFTNRDLANSYTNNILYGDYEIIADYNNNYVNGVATTDLVTPSYLQNIEFSPYSTLVSIEFAYDQNADLFTYTYTIQAEDRTIAPNTFTHYLVELTPNNMMQSVFIDGSLSSNVISNDNTASISFKREENPLVRVLYDLTNYYIDEQAFQFVLNNTEITPYLLGTGYEVGFDSTNSVYDYEINAKYQNEKEINGINVVWDLDMGTLTISKLPSDITLLTNIEFISNTVYTGLNTMLDVAEIDVPRYERLVNNQESLQIVCLPSGIFYNGLDTHEGSFYIVGQVMRTDLEFFSPVFTLPNNETTIYRKLTELDEILYKTDSTAFTDPDNTYYVSPNKVVYRLESDNSLLEMGNLEANYEADFSLSIDEETRKFNFYEYRVYAENKSFYRDYYISVQDVQNNVKFVVNIEYSDDLNTKLDKVFVSFNNYGLPEVETSGFDNNYEYSTITYSMSLFGYYYSSNTLTNKEFTTTTAGYYEVLVDLPKGLTFTINGDRILTGDISNRFKVNSNVVTMQYEITITIINDESEIDWGYNNIIGFDKKN